MPVAVLGLVSALVYGAADFLGGLAARRIGPVRTTAVGATAGLALLLLLLPVAGGVWSAAAIGWGALSGIVAAVAVGLLYACLAIGPMSILSPLTALVSALVPASWGLLGGDRFEPVGYLALGLAVVAVVLVGFVPEKGAVRASTRALLMAVGAGAMIGVFLILLDQTPDDSGVVPLIANRAVNSAVMWLLVAVLLLRRRRGSTGLRLERRGLAIATVGGALDASANVLILIGLRMGDLTTMSVLVALYPAGTVLLAAVVLRERVAVVQWFGLALAIVAAALLSIS